SHSTLYYFFCFFFNLFVCSFRGKCMFNIYNNIELLLLLLLLLLLFLKFEPLILFSHITC
ncbi:MAG: hypothetical protein N7Q72_06975, partial [Spiroplasma sp. Tabriz.8]|nr:hypothetical protein [Spiroplasma sp. Tabriz.8]